SAIKKMLHLLECTSGSYIHSPIEFGGLGFRDPVADLNFSQIMRSLLALEDKNLLGTLYKERLHKSRREPGEDYPDNISILKLLNTLPAKGRSVPFLTIQLKKLEKMNITLTSNDEESIVFQFPYPLLYGKKSFPILSKSMASCRAYISIDHFRQHLKLKWQGANAKTHAKSSISNKIMSSGGIPVLVQYWLYAARLVLLPTKASLQIRSMQSAAEHGSACGLCGKGIESISHILNSCMVSKIAQYARHNAILKIIEKNLILPAGAIKLVNRKYTISAVSENLRPDLLILMNNSSTDYLIDITIPFDNEENFTNASQRKIEKYGSLGSIPAITHQSRTPLGLTHKQFNTLLEKCVRSSIIWSK
ncbi:hypothetical protein HZS_4375, partial [Henneguya salminicola]